MGRFANKKRVLNNNIGKHCQMLIDDFFNYTDGRVKLVRCVRVDDIKEPMPPSVEQLRTMMSRTKKAWYDYCKFVGLPMESRKLLINKIKDEWHRREAALKKKSVVQKKTTHSAKE